MNQVKFDFSGRSAFVTGAGGGIGFQIASDLVRAGCTVTAIDVKAEPVDFPDGPGCIVYQKCDVCDSDAVASAVATAAFKHLDFAVNAAGVALWHGDPEQRDGAVPEIDMNAWDKTMQINLLGVVHVVRAAIPHMLRQASGALVHIASVIGARSMDNAMKTGPLDAYQISKAGVISLSRSLAITYGPKGIRSNTVCPGSILTPMTASIYRDATRVEGMVQRTPLHKIGKPEDVSHAALFLLSDNASFITGTDLIVDGGLMAKLG